MKPAPIVAGVDGCRGGWLVATVAADALDVRRVELRGIGEVLDDLTLTAVAIDMPIGLPDEGPRACDRLARRRLPGRGSTVYPAPRRAALGCSSYAEARTLLARLGGPSLSAQAWGLVRSVKVLDDLLTPADERRVVEAHPEVAFAKLCGLTGTASPLAPKRTSAGRDARRTLLAGWRPDAVAAADGSRLPGTDALDALACAWVAERFSTGRAEILTDGRRDGRGLLMRIAG